MHNEIDESDADPVKDGHAEILHKHGSRLSKLEQAHEEILSAFPTVDGNTDLDKHRIHHEELINSKNKRTKLWEDVKKQTLTSGLWVMIIWLGASGWEFIKFKLGIK